MKCNICNSDCKILFEGTILYKYNIKYYRCQKCGFIETEIPYWLDESYETAITSTDIGLLSRNIFLSDVVSKLIIKNFDATRKFLDYGGGYGVLVRLLRDKGINFYREDPYCENLFAVHFDIKNINKIKKFELVTCFEVFEHIYEPYQLLDILSSYSENILFSTLLVPEAEMSNIQNWWYIAPNTGQHIAFYTMKALEEMARRYHFYLYTNGSDLHLFTKQLFRENPLKTNRTIWNKLVGKITSTFFISKDKGPESLVAHDLTVIKQAALNESKS